MSEIEWPQNDEAERAVLGAVLVRNEHLAAAAEILSPADFHAKTHQLAFRSMLSMSKESLPIDLLTLGDRLAGDPGLEAKGGVAYLSRLMDGVPEVLNLAHYANIVREKSVRRQMVRLGTEMASEAFGASDPSALASKVSDALLGLRSARNRHRWKEFSDVLEKGLDETAAAAKREGALRGITTGFPALDELIGGWERGKFMLVGGTSGMGKTALMMSFAVAAAGVGVKVAFFSLEMGAAEVSRRMFGIKTGTNAQKLKTGAMTDHDWGRVELAVRQLNGLPIVFADDEDGSSSIDEISSRVTALHEESPLGLIVVDYLQLIDPARGAQTREQEVTQMGRSLKRLAQKLGVPIIAGSQLMGEADKREGRPQRGDLRESKALAHDADILMFVYRPWLQMKRLGKSSSEAPESGFIIVDKQRDGAEDSIPVRWDKDAARYMPLLPTAKPLQPPPQNPAPYMREPGDDQDDD